MRILIHSIKKDSENLNAIFDISSVFCKSGFELFFLDTFFDFLKENNYSIDIAFKRVTIEEIKELKFDFILSFGGDGTVLQALDIIQYNNIPVIGINTGNLGFLTKFCKNSANTIIENINNNTYLISFRNVLEVSFENGKKMYALNEISLTRKIVEMIEITTYINDKLLTTYRADGLIISTATGSTAYSLSCGGPILTPEVNNFILTPISPHNLNFRPLIIPENCTVRCNVSHRHIKNQKINITADTKTRDADQNTDIIIKKSDFQLQMFETEENNFFDTIREKLLWGGDYRI